MTKSGGNDEVSDGIVPHCHSRAGENPDHWTAAIFKGYKRPVIPAQAGIQTLG
ncbi:TPA: hypothetical protein ACQUHZ_002027 [Neisseria cinerea]